MVQNQQPTVRWAWCSQNYAKPEENNQDVSSTGVLLRCLNAVIASVDITMVNKPFKENLEHNKLAFLNIWNILPIFILPQQISDNVFVMISCFGICVLL